MPKKKKGSKKRAVQPKTKKGTIKGDPEVVLND
jgi:hypothetical protein